MYICSTVLVVAVIYLTAVARSNPVDLLPREFLHILNNLRQMEKQINRKAERYAVSLE